MERIRDRLNLSPILEMPIGSLGYTPHWSLFRGDSGEILINEHYSVNPEAIGTFDLLVKRTETGVIVYRHTLDESKPITGTRYDYMPNCYGLAVEIE